MTKVLRASSADAHTMAKMEEAVTSGFGKYGDIADIHRGALFHWQN